MRSTRIVGHEIAGDLTGYEAGTGGLAYDQRHCVLDFAEALAFDDRSKQHLAAEIMARGIELEGAIAAV